MGIYTAGKRLDIDIYDYKRGRKDVILISVGSGMGLALMDNLKNVRYFIDYKEIKYKKLQDLLSLYEKEISIIYIASWFSISKPKKLLNSIKPVLVNKIKYYSNVELIGERLENLVEMLNFDKVLFKMSEKNIYLNQE